jgi:5-methylcytosine-specific restriction endonuclease McrA
MGLKKAMGAGWVFTRCPECHRGTPLDIVITYLSKTGTEEYLDGFCDRHWFKDSGICGYCKMKREGHTENVS